MRQTNAHPFFLFSFFAALNYGAYDDDAIYFQYDSSTPSSMLIMLSGYMTGLGVCGYMRRRQVNTRKHKTELDDDDDLDSISVFTTNAPVAVFRTCIKHQRKMPHPEKESPCQGCSALSGLNQA
jgi:hypothetical protein